MVPEPSIRSASPAYLCLLLHAASSLLHQRYIEALAHQQRSSASALALAVAGAGIVAIPFGLLSAFVVNWFTPLTAIELTNLQPAAVANAATIASICINPTRSITNVVNIVCTHICFHPSGGTHSSSTCRPIIHLFCHRIGRVHSAMLNILPPVARDCGPGCWRAVVQR